MPTHNLLLLCSGEGSGVIFYLYIQRKFIYFS